MYLNRVVHCVYLFPASKKLQFLMIIIEFFMAGHQSKAVVVMIRGLAKSSISNVEVPGSNLTEGTFCFLSSFALVILFLFKIKPNTATALVEGKRWHTCLYVVFFSLALFFRLAETSMGPN